MINSSNHQEHRESTRTSTARPAIWSSDGCPEARIGWMLETSETGCAFAWRGEGVPVKGEVISVSVGESADPLMMSRGLVKRVEVVHDDLAIIAVRLLPAWVSLPPIGRAEAKSRKSTARARRGGLLPRLFAGSGVAESDPLASTG